MQGFPKHIATRQDYLNLLDMDEYRDEALDKLRELRDFDDREATRATQPMDEDDPESEWETERIENPHPMHRQRGFELWLDLVELEARETRGRKSIATKKEEILSEYSKDEIESAIVEVT